MAHYAEIVNGVVANIAVCDDPAFAQAQGWVGPIDTITPHPGIGWTYDGTNWTAPTPPPPSPQQQAQEQVVQLAATIPGHITQAQADAQTIAGIAAGSPLTAEQVTAMINHANGWVSLLQGLQTLLAAQGVGT